MQNDRRRTCAGQGCGDLFPDVAGLAHADDDNLVATGKRLEEEIHSLAKAGVQPFRRSGGFGKLDLENAPRALQIIHRRSLRNPGPLRKSLTSRAARNHRGTG